MPTPPCLREGVSWSQSTSPTLREAARAGDEDAVDILQEQAGHDPVEAFGNAPTSDFANRPFGLERFDDFQVVARETKIVIDQRG